MTKKRYRVRKEQLERVVESFVMESAAPEAKKHVSGSVDGKMIEKSVKDAPEKDWGIDDEPSHAPEAKKHVSGSESGTMVNKRSTPGKMTHKMKHAPEAKKHVSGSVSESINESELITEGMIRDFVDAVKSVVAKLKPEIVKMAKQNPEVMADLKSAARDMGEEEVAELGVSVNESKMYESLFGEGLITEGIGRKIIGNVLKALGLSGLVAGIPAFLSQVSGFTDWSWTAKLHNMVQPFCDALPPRMCGPLFFLGIGISIFLLVKGAMIKNKA